MLQQINKTMERFMPLITPSSVLIGVILASILSPYTGWVPWIFAFMTFSGSLSMNFRDLGKVLSHPLPIIVFFLITHTIMPLVAWSIGYIAFPGDPLTITGLILLLSIPTGIVSFMWVSIYRGHIALTLSIILIDTMLAPFVVPAALSLFVGTKVEINTWGMMEGLFWMIVIPSLVGMLLNQWTKGRIKSKVGPTLAPFSKLGLALVVAINSSAIADYFTNFNRDMIYLFLICILVVACGYVIGWGAAKLFRWDHATVTSLTFNCGMRNISAGAVLAITYFPPAVTVPVVMGMCFQQMMASLFAHLLFRARSDHALPSSVHKSA